MFQARIVRTSFFAVFVMGSFFAPSKAMAVFPSAPYFPLAPPNSSWTSQVDDTDTSTVTVNPTPVTINTVQTTELDTVSTIPAVNGSKLFITSNSNGIDLHRTFTANVNLGGFVGIRDVTLTFIPPVMLTDNDTINDIGHTANTAGVVQVDVEGLGTSSTSPGYTSSFTVKGFETVTVPAGIFYNVLKISGSIQVTGTATFGFIQTQINQNLGFTFYLAQNIGPVKGVTVVNGVTRNGVLTGSTFLPAAETALAAAVLPSSRSAQVGTPVTAFATIINGGGATATQCGLSALLNSVNPLPITFGYQTTDAGNNLTGSLNTPVDIGPGVPQGYVFSVTASAPFAPTDLKIIFDCTNTNPAPIIVGVSTLLVSASAGAIADIVALIATNPPNDGIARISDTNGSVAFGVATVNVGGAGASIIASADTGGVGLPLSINLCETNPANGQCISAIGPTVTTQIDPGETNTFSFFVTGSGNITFNPATKRIFARFKVGAVTHGSSSVAVCTDTDPSCP